MGGELKAQADAWMCEGEPLQRHAQPTQPDASATHTQTCLNLYDSDGTLMAPTARLKSCSAACAQRSMWPAMATAA